MPELKTQRSLWISILLNTLFSVFIVCSSLWLCLAIWFQQPFGQWFSHFLIVGWLIFALGLLGIYFSHRLLRQATARWIYCGIFSLSLLWYFNIEAKQDRIWDPEVAELLHYTRQNDQITLYNVRNFNWHDTKHYTEHWETRRFNLHDIEGANIITSYWMGPQIAHTLVSFDIKNQKPLVFSIEIRKKKGEAFSALGGFFRKFELSLVAADEKDILYTRSQIRGEQVYFFPTTMTPKMAQDLFVEYLATADHLAASPEWYNTLTSNCTTLVFDMMQVVTHHQLPLDYRLLASGYLPNYLHDLHALPFDWDMKTWYQRAHINPKVPQNQVLSSAEYSALIRQGLVQHSE